MKTWSLFRSKRHSLNLVYHSELYLQTINIRVAKTSSAPEHFQLPEYATAGAAGMDLRAAIQSEVVLHPNERKLIPAGFTIEIPEGYEGQVRPRSGLALKNGITLLNSPGTIDSDYRGEVGIIMINLGTEDFVITPGARIAQLVIAPVARAILSHAEEL